MSKQRSNKFSPEVRGAARAIGRSRSGRHDDTIGATETSGSSGIGSAAARAPNSSHLYSE